MGVDKALIPGVNDALVALGRALQRDGTIGQGIPHEPSLALATVLEIARMAAEAEDK